MPLVERVERQECGGKQRQRNHAYRITPNQQHTHDDSRSAGDRDEANHLVDEALGLARSGGYWLLEDQALAVLAGL